MDPLISSKCLDHGDGDVGSGEEWPVKGALFENQIVSIGPVNTYQIKGWEAVPLMPLEKRRSGTGPG